MKITLTVEAYGQVDNERLSEVRFSKAVYLYDRKLGEETMIES